MSLNLFPNLKSWRLLQDNIKITPTNDRRGFVFLVFVKISWDM